MKTLIRMNVLVFYKEDGQILPVLPLIYPVRWTFGLWFICDMLETT